LVSVSAIDQEHATASGVQQAMDNSVVVRVRIEFDARTGPTEDVHAFDRDSVSRHKVDAALRRCHGIVNVEEPISHADLRACEWRIWRNVFES